MKKLLFILLLLPVLSLSCHKSKKSSCGDYFIGIGLSPGGNTFPPYFVTLFTINANTGQAVNNFQNSAQVVSIPGWGALGVYDHIHNYYYLYGATDSTHAVLYRLNTNTGSVSNLGAPIFDTATGNFFFYRLICNSTTGNLYLYGYDGSQTKIYEVIPSNGSFRQR